MRANLFQSPARRPNLADYTRARPNLIVEFSLRWQQLLHRFFYDLHRNHFHDLILGFFLDFFGSELELSKALSN